MSSLTAPLILVAARARRRPARWLLPTIGLALAAAFACVIAAEGTITGDRAAHAVLTSVPAAQRVVTITWQGPAQPATDRRARRLLDELGLPSQTRIALLEPVRLSGVVVRLAAIDPLARWVSASIAPKPGPCRARGCPMLLVSGQLPTARLSAAGVHVEVAGRGVLSSAAPLGFSPAATPGPPVLITGDPAGLANIAGLAGIYRTQAWLALPALAQLHSWQLASVLERLQRAQAELAQDASQFSLSGPFGLLQSAQSRAAVAPRRLALAGGGALAALAVFIVLAAYGLRRDQRDELARLRAAGARSGQLIVFALAEAGWLTALGLAAGAVIGMTVAALLAGGAGLPVGKVLAHSLLTPAGALALLGGWVAAAALIGCVLLMPGRRIADVLGIAAAAGLALALSRGATAAGAPALLLAPLTCVAGGALVYRVAGAALRTGERISRRGPVPVRLALVGLARAPTAPALAVAFVAVSVGLAGFALGYRATLERGAADQAAYSVPLDARITPTASFAPPLELASIAHWRTLAAGGPVLPVRRTYASYLDGGQTVTVPALGVPAGGLPMIRRWRSGDGSATPAVLARRLAPHGPVRAPGPQLPAGGRWMALRMSSPAGVQVSADLRSPSGAVTQVSLGLASPRPRTARVRLAPGRHELEALELDEPTGLEATNGHQNAENQAAATQSSTDVRLGPLLVGGPGRRRWVSLRGWRGVGAASGGTSESAPTTAGTAAAGSVRVRFADTGEPGVVRPRQPSDTAPVPVLTDPATAAAATSSGQLALTVDGLPVAARVVGTLIRFPTLGSGQAGLVVADEATLAGALDASLPGQGRPDELWIATAHPARLRAALGSGTLSQLGAGFRSDVESTLRADPVAVGVLGTLTGAAAVATALAIIGLLASLVGAMREPQAERDLEVQGLGPRQLRVELGLRVLAAGVLGIGAGLLVAGVLTRLAVVTVRAAGAVAAPDPPLVTVIPVAQLALLAVGALVSLAIAGWLAASGVVGRRRTR